MIQDMMNLLSQADPEVGASVREELRQIQTARQEKAETVKQQDVKGPARKPILPTQMHQNPGKKKPNLKVR